MFGASYQVITINLMAIIFGYGLG